MSRRLERARRIEVVRMAREDACEHDMLVQIRGKGGRWPFLFPNWSPSIQTNQPRKLSALGITGFRRVTAFNLRTATDSSHCNSASTPSELGSIPGASDQGLYFGEGRF